MRRLKVLTRPELLHVKVCIHKCHLSGEFRVRVYRSGIPADYFTTEITDALGTAKLMLEEEWNAQ